MNYHKLEKFVSKPRLDRYLVACGNMRERAQRLYEANIIVAQAFYPILNLFETFLRNAINEKLASHFGDAAWIITEKRGFMDNISLAPKYYLKNQVLSAEKNTRGTITPGKIVAEQPFGFWTSLFEPKHYALISGSLIHCFPYKPPYVNRLIIHTTLKDIREFRNRVYHNENICFNNITIDFTNAQRIKSEIYRLLEWMDVELKNYTKQFDKVDAEITKALAI
jgi:hypothetical protein